MHLIITTTTNVAAGCIYSSAGNRSHTLKHSQKTETRAADMRRTHHKNIHTYLFAENASEQFPEYWICLVQS